MNQRERLIKSLGMIHLPSILTAKHMISITLSEAQYKPPQGNADGSISDELWSCFWAVESSLGGLILDLRKLMNELNRTEC